MGERKGAYGVLVGKRPLERLRHGWKYNIKVDLQDVEWGGMD